MKILIIAPLPPPMSGNALPAKVLFDEMSPDNVVEVINLNKESYKAGINSIGRLVQIFKILLSVRAKSRNKDVIYLTVAESFAGNLRDIFIYIICFRYLSRIVIHMFGGAVFIKKQNRLSHAVNKFFISRLGAVIVEGKTQAEIFSQMALRGNIHVVPNFAEDFLFTTESEICENFNHIEPLKVLFLSNLIYGKGYEELVGAYCALNDDLKSKIVIDFAGGVESEDQKEEFLRKIEGFSNLKYHGSVSGLVKKSLYTNAHVFCLPTYYPYEGQPFCILEAYSTGCVVVTTNHSGIRNVFTGGVNGFEVEKQSIESLKGTLEEILQSKSSLCSIAVSNLKNARDQYTKDGYISKMLKIFNAVVAINRET